MRKKKDCPRYYVAHCSSAHDDSLHPPRFHIGQNLTECRVVWLAVWLAVCPVVCLVVCLVVYLVVCLVVCLVMCLVVCLVVCLSGSACTCAPNCLSVLHPSTVLLICFVTRRHRAPRHPASPCTSSLCVTLHLVASPYLVTLHQHQVVPCQFAPRRLVSRHCPLCYFVQFCRVSFYPVPRYYDVHCVTLCYFGRCQFE